MIENDPFHKRIALALRLNMKMEMLVDGCTNHRFSTEEADQFEQFTAEFLAIYADLARVSIERHLELFDVTIKSHYTQHCSRQASQISLKKSWNFTSEDYMKHMKRLAGTCTRGVRHHNVVSKLAEEYLYALDMMCKNHQERSE